MTHNLHTITNYSPTYFLGRYRVWYESQYNTPRTHARTVSQNDLLTSEFSSNYIGSHNSLLDRNLAKLYQLFVSNDAKPFDFDQFMAFLAEWLIGNSSYYLKLADSDSNDSTINTEFDLAAATNRLARIIQQNNPEHFSGQQINDNRQLIGFTESSQRSLKDLLNSSDPLPNELIFNETLKRYCQQLSAIFHKRLLLPNFLAELAVFGSSTEDSININDFLTNLQKGGLALTDTELKDTKSYYSLKLSEKAFINEFSAHIDDYYQSKISFESFWQYVHDYLLSCEQDDRQPLAAKFYPRLEFMLNLIRLQEDNAKKEGLIRQIEQHFIAYALEQYKNQKGIDSDTQDYIKNKLKEKGYAVIGDVSSSLSLAASAPAPAKNNSVSRFKESAINVFKAVRDFFFAIGRLLATVFTWLVLAPSILFTANASLAAQDIKDDELQDSNKKNIVHPLNDHFGSNAAANLHSKQPIPASISANQAATETPISKDLATSTQAIVSTADQGLYKNKGSLRQRKPSHDQPNNPAFGFYRHFPYR